MELLISSWAVVSCIKQNPATAIVIPIDPASFCFWGSGDSDTESNKGASYAGQKRQCEIFHDGSYWLF
ncbi:MULTISPECIES: hypothetical protein [unclassified Synechococcus]|uniref:hypothetical protein n=1 Tax=unclassified Synechococcus TaxID=2626047 RepID=UPI001CF8C479|nr:MULTISPECIES: hypothetical protein [unclassified Synechococcus]MCB4410427.1 hypothetical protein [Synechococcus sp. MU1611]